MGIRNRPLRPLLALLLVLALLLPQQVALADPAAVLVFPSGGETLIQGQSYTIRWRMDGYTGPSDLVNLEYSTDDGSHWTNIRQYAPNSGSYEWRVPRLTTSRARIRLQVLEWQPGSDFPVTRFTGVSGRFRITIPAMPSVTLRAPRPATDGDLTLAPGQTYAIDWAATGLDAMAVSFSSDGGATWTTIEDCLNPAARPLNWTVPSVATAAGIIRLQGRLGTCATPGPVWWTDQNLHPFRIQPGANRAPILGGGGPQTVRSGARVTLPATMSEPDGDALRYSWRQVSGPPATLSSTTVLNPSFTAPAVTRAEDLIFEVTADDSPGRGSNALSVTARTLVTVLPGLPTVSSVSASCAGAGQTVTVTGHNLSGGVLYFNGTPAITSGSSTSRIAVVPAGATTGPLTLRYPWGESLTLAPRFEVPTVSIGRVVVTQGVKDFPLIWRKQTIVQVFPVASPAASCRPIVEGGTLQVITSGGPRFSIRGVAGNGTSLTTLAVPRTTVVAERRDNAINFVVPPGYLSFNLSSFQGFRFTLLTNGTTVAAGEVSAAALPRFQDVTANRDAIRAVVVWYYQNGSLDPNWGNDLAAMERTVLRTYPVSGFASDLFPRTYMRPVDGTLAADIPGYLFVQLDAERFRRAYNDSVSSDRQARLVAGVIDRSAWRTSDASGRAFGFLTASIDQFGNGPTLAQEMGHNLGLVPPWNRNYDWSNPFHSKYDEGESGPCQPALSYGQSLRDQLPGAHSILNTYILDEFTSLPGCTNAAKSVMSYAPNKTSDNVFLEFDDYKHLLQAGGGTAFFDRTQFADLTGMAQGQQDFEIVGSLTQAGEVTITQSQIKPAGVSDLPEKESAYALYFLDANGSVLLRHPFRVSFDVTHGGKTDTTVFSVRAPYTQGTATVEVRNGDKVLAGLSRPAQGPSISLKVEEGSTGSGPVKLSWNASHPTAKDLVVDLLISRDGGKTYDPLVMSLRTSSIALAPDQVPGGPTVVKAVVSDGFNTSSATVELRKKDTAPRAAITDPAPGARFAAGNAVPLSGVAYDLEDGMLTSEANLQWSSSLDGYLGGGSLLLASLSPGEHVITLAATDAAGNVSKVQTKVTASESREKLLWSADEGCGKAFPDVPGQHPACAAVELLAATKVVNGYPDGTFLPDKGVTRAEFAKMAVLALGQQPNPDGALPFSDVKGHWAAMQGYLQTAVALGLINGFPDGTFRPEEPVTRAQAIKIAAAAMGLTASGTPPYSDISPSDWFAGWVAAAHAAHIIGPEAPFHAFTAKEFLGNQSGARAESALVLANLMQISP